MIIENVGLTSKVNYWLFHHRYYEPHPIQTRELKNSFWLNAKSLPGNLRTSRSVLFHSCQAEAVGGLGSVASCCCHRDLWQWANIVWTLPLRMLKDAVPVLCIRNQNLKQSSWENSLTRTYIAGSPGNCGAGDRGSVVRFLGFGFFFFSQPNVWTDA